MDTEAILSPSDTLLYMHGITSASSNRSCLVQSEENLAARVRCRDEAAFTEIYEANFDKIYRYLTLKIGNKMEAEDLTQQVFLNAYKSASSFEWKGTPIVAWLYRIAHNQMVDYLRKKSRTPTVSIEKTAPVVASDDPAEMAEVSFSADELAEASKKLTALQNEVISLRFTSQLSIREVAKIMGKSEGAVKALQHSAVEALRRAFLAVEHAK